MKLFKLPLIVLLCLSFGACASTKPTYTAKQLRVMEIKKQRLEAKRSLRRLKVQARKNARDFRTTKQDREILELGNRSRFGSGFDGY